LAKADGDDDVSGNVVINEVEKDPAPVRSEQEAESSSRSANDGSSFPSWPEQRS